MTSFKRQCPSCRQDFVYKIAEVGELQTEICPLCLMRELEKPEFQALRKKLEEPEWVTLLQD